jgi:hypothetical protein
MSRLLIIRNCFFLLLLKEVRTYRKSNLTRPLLLMCDLLFTVFSYSMRDLLFTVFS